MEHSRAFTFATILFSRREKSIKGLRLQWMTEMRVPISVGALYACQRTETMRLKQSSVD